MTFRFINGDDEERRLSYSAGETPATVLLRHRLPPSGVLVTENGRPVSSFAELRADGSYRAILLERYDVDRITDLYRSDAERPAYSYQRISLGDDALSDNRAALSAAETRAFVERRFAEVVEEYDLFAEGEVLFGYSGGIDSTALLHLFGSLDTAARPRLHALTIEDYWGAESEDSVTVPDGVAGKVDVNRIDVSEREIRDRYGLTEPLSAVLAEIHAGDYALDPLAVGNAINRRLFEAHAERRGIGTICVGDHSTDVLAGILSSLFGSTPSYRDRFPRNRFGGFSYVYPLSFHTKLELATYLRIVSDRPITHGGFDPWEVNTAARHFHYYLADVLQSFAPGIIHWLHEPDGPSRQPETTDCHNCGKTIADGPHVGDCCQVCDLFAEMGCLT